MKNKIKELNISETEINELLKVSKNIEKDYNKLLEKYPIQYLIGYVNFYGYKIYVNENVLIPRYETELLVEKTIKYASKMFKEKVKVLDIGTGSGAIAIAINKELNSNVTAVDVSKKALKIAAKNALENDCQINFINSSIFNNINDRYDIIISNPPYISYNEKIMESVYKYEPHIALFADEDGLYFYKEIIKEARKHLNKRFIIAFEIGMTQGNKIQEYARNYFKKEVIKIEKDFSGKDRYLFIINE